MKRLRACLSSRVLLQVLRGTLRESQRPSVESHLASCAECRAVAEVAAEALSLGVDGTALQDRIAAAASFVADLEREPTLHAMRSLLSTSGMGADRFVAGRLLARSREEFARDPRKSLGLARAGIWTAERATSGEIQFHGWLDCSSIFVRLGQFNEAWEALDRAGTFVPETSEPGHAAAMLLYARAYVASQPDVWKIDEALAWTEEAARIFSRTDEKRLRSTDEMRAYLHYCRGEYAAAVEICRTLWAVHREVGLALNFASYLVPYGDPDSAHELLAWARPLIDDEDVVTIIRHAGIAGRVSEMKQEWDTACEAFGRAVEGYRAVGMEDSAIRIELSRIRCAVSAAPDSMRENAKAMEDLRRVIGASVELDRREPTRRRRFTVEALEYLRELEQMSALTVDAFRHVEEYLDAIRRGPARPFVRPLPVRVM